MAYSYKSNISFGLVYIPVTLHLSVKDNDIKFNFVDKKSLSRVKYVKTCLDCSGKEVANEDIVKGYEYESGNYVLIENEDFEKIKSKRDKAITIEKFVLASHIDPIYYAKTYYIAPAGAEQAYNLLLAAMEEKGMAGIAKTVLGTKETLIVIRVKEGQMLLNTLFFQDEIQAPPAVNSKTAVAGKELELAKSLIENMSGNFDPNNYKDEYREKLLALIESKISGKALSLPKEKSERHTAGSLMDALVKSIESAQKPQTTSAKKSPASKTTAKSTKGAKTTKDKQVPPSAKKGTSARA
ncbi:MAG: Ku protein [Clostridia bacterium]